MKINPIETPRLVLRGFTKDDARFAISIWNDPEMGEFLPDAAMTEIDPKYLAMIETLGDDEECCYMISVSKETGERIGTCSFIPDKTGKVYDIAYCVHRNFWNRGYATEMAQGMIGYFRSIGAEKVTVEVSKENAASNAVVRKCGFRPVREGTYKKRGTDVTMTDIKYELVL